MWLSCQQHLWSTIIYCLYSTHAEMPLEIWNTENFFFGPFSHYWTPPISSKRKKFKIQRKLEHFVMGFNWLNVYPIKQLLTGIWQRSQTHKFSLVSVNFCEDWVKHAHKCYQKLMFLGVLENLNRDTSFFEKLSPQVACIQEIFVNCLEE